MNPLNLNFINRLTPYKVWTDNGCDYFIETTNGRIFIVGFMEDYILFGQQVLISLLSIIQVVNLLPMTIS